MALTSENTRLVARGHVAFRTTTTGGLIVDLQTGATFEVNRVGADVWTLITAGGSTVFGIVEGIRSTYDVSAESAESDVAHFCGEMLVAGLIAQQD